MAGINIQFIHSSIQEYLAAEVLYEDYTQRRSGDEVKQLIGSFASLKARSPLWRRAIDDFFDELAAFDVASEGKQTDDFTDDEAWHVASL